MKEEEEEVVLFMHFIRVQIPRAINECWIRQCVGFGLRLPSGLCAAAMKNLRNSPRGNR